MVALRFFAMLLLAGSIALPAHASVFPYETVSNSGDNNVIDSNATSCSSVAGQGCYERGGKKCSENPNAICDLQIVPAGRCSFGDLLDPENCTFPHRAGRCDGNNNVGCLTTTECADLTPNTCDLTFDVFGRAADPNDATSCACQGTQENALLGGCPDLDFDDICDDFETIVCQGGPSVCSDGDPTRDVGGHGTAIGVELKLGGPGSQTFAGFGPATTGQSTPESGPSYGIENPPYIFDPQRDAGSVARGPDQGTGLIHKARATTAVDITVYSHPTILVPVPVRKIVSFGDSSYGDWAFISVKTTGTFNTHIVGFPCDPQSGWIVGEKVDIAPTGVGPEDLYCHQAGAARNGISFNWAEDLTPAQVTAFTVGGKRICPPNCNKDFNLSTMELQELVDTGTSDPNAGIQLAMQNGEPLGGRQAGQRDSIGVAVLTTGTFLTDNDLRCKIGGWGNSGGEVGRCSDGARVCVPGGTAGDYTCGTQGGTVPAQGGSCRSCMGVVTGGNPLGIPEGYATHGRTELLLFENERIGGITGQDMDLPVPLFVVATTGNVTSDFRDKLGEGVPDVDLSEMGPVRLVGGLAFAPGIGEGGTFVNTHPAAGLAIAEACCTGGTSVSWQLEQGGEVEVGFANGFSYATAPSGVAFLSNWLNTYDKGPGLDGIPGCMGDNDASLALANSCNRRLGEGPVGDPANGYYATGKDDRALVYPIGAVTIPASTPKFINYRDASPTTMTYFLDPPAILNPPTFNTVAAFSLRDLKVFAERSADVMVKANTTSCPLTDEGPVCTPDPCAGLGGDADDDLICQSVDLCPNFRSAINTDGDADGVGDPCDNCPTVANGLAQAAVTGVGNQIDGTTVWTTGQLLESAQPFGPVGGGSPPLGDGVGDACDNCRTRRNPKVAPALFATEALFFASNQWATLSGGQRDDDHDGFGNRCDGDFNQAGALIDSADLTQYRPSSGKARSSLTACGSPAGQRCSRYDVSEAGALIDSADLTIYRDLSGKARGPKCPTCTGVNPNLPLPCTSGTAVTCTSP